ncbi:ATP synthase F0 subunit C [bacterium]|nr:ATP synthase F0 subunit C [bacterium]
MTGLETFLLVCVVTAGFALSAAAIGGAFSMGKSVSKALESIARQPEAGNSIRTNLIIGLAMIESLVIYVLVIALIILYANPFIKYFVH